MAETPDDIEYRYRLLVEHVTDYAILMLGTDGRVTSWNEGAERILGYAASEIIGSPGSLVFTPEDRERALPEQELATAARDGRATDERWHLRKDGSRFYASGVMTAVRDDAGRLVGFAKLLRDRTERKLAEARLVTEHAVGRALAESSTLSEAIPAVLEAVCRTGGWQYGSLWEVDAGANVLRWVQAWCDPAVKTAEFEETSQAVTFAQGVGLPGRVWADGAPAWIADVSEDANFPRRQAAAQAGLHAAVAFPIVAGGQRLGVMEFFGRDARPPDNRLLEMMVVIGRQVGQSIHRRRAEEGLGASEARNAAILEASLDCIVSMDHAGNVVEWNPAAEQTFGYTRAEAIGREMADLIIPPALRQPHRVGLATYLATGEGPIIGRRVEITAVRKDGAEFPVELTVTRVPLPGAPTFTGHLRDITERKRAERELADAQRELERKVEERTRELAYANIETRLEREFLAAVLESAEDGIVACDADGTLRLFNRATRQFHGLPEEPLPPERWADHYDLYLPDGSTRMTTEQVPLFRALREGTVRDAEMVIAPKDGEPRHLSANGRAIHDAGGAKIGAVVVMHDLTERRLAEARRADETRRKSEFRFQRLVEHSPLSTQLFWPDGRTRKVNAAFTRLFGITLDELEDYNILQDPQLVAVGIMPLMERAFAGEAVVINPIPYVPDRGEYAGQTRWAGAHAYPVKDDAGRIDEVVLVHVDVTERKHAEAALRESEERLRLGLDAGNTGTWDWDIVKGSVTWSERVYEFHGVKSGEFSGRVEDFAKLIHPDDAERVQVAIQEAIDHRTPYVVEFRVVHPDESVHWIATNGKVYYDTNGKPLRMLGATSNITDRTMAEEEVRRARVEAERDLARWRAVVEGMTEGLVLTDPQGNVLSMNPAALAIHEFASVDGMLKTLADYPGLFVLHDAAGRLMPLDEWPLSRVLRGERLSGYEVQVRRRDTGRAWIGSYGGTTVRNAAGDAILAVLTVRDVTAQKTAEAAVAESEARFRQLAETIPQLAWVARPDGHIYWYNRRWYDYTGTTPEQMEGWGWQRVHDPDVLPVVLERWRASIATGEPFEMEFPIRGADGAFRPFLTRVAALRDHAGAVVQWFGTNTDVTEQRRAAEERERLLAGERAARAEAERQGRMKDEFLATLSHELRTPLNAILGWAQLLRTGGLANTEDVRQGLETIERNARAQTKIIEDLLEMSRIISGKLRLDVQRVHLASVIEASAETVRHAAEARGVRLQLVLDPHAGPVSGDPARLQQVFWNLLSNSVKFSPRGGRVQVLLERVNSHLEVSVIDDGEGIKPEFLPHVFDRFRQADSTTTRQHGGLGLGLSIVKQLVELHGGIIRAKSPGVGLGATFVVVLPLTSVHADPEPAPQRRHPSGDDGLAGATAAATAAAAATACVKLTGMKVLVVDDEADARALAKRVLEGCEAVVTTAGSATEALEAFRRERPDILLSDIGMPGEDGYTLIRMVRALEPNEGGNVPAVALTAYARSEDRTRAMLAGYQMHLSKPVEPAELIATIAALGKPITHRRAK